MLCQKRWSLPDSASLSIQTSPKRTKPNPDCALALFAMEIELPEEDPENACIYLQEHYEFLEYLSAKTVAQLLREHQLFITSCRLNPRAEAICFRYGVLAEYSHN